MFGIGQSWYNNDDLTKTPSVRFESQDRAQSALQYMGSQGRWNQYYSLDYVYALKNANAWDYEGSKYETVVNMVNEREIKIPKNGDGNLFPISRFVHADEFLMGELEYKDGVNTFLINTYKIDKVKGAIKKIASQQMEHEGSPQFTYNEESKYGVTMDALVKANTLDLNQYLVLGQKLVIPVTGTIVNNV